MLRTLFGIKNNRTAADKTTAIIDPATKTIFIRQEGLFAVIESRRDSLEAEFLLSSVSEADVSSRLKLAHPTMKSCELYRDRTAER